MNIVGEFEYASKRGAIDKDNSSNSKQVWQTPGCGIYKVNSAWNGDLEVAEALAARQTLSIAIDAGLRHIVLEMDCMKLMRHLQQQKMENSSFGIIVNDILGLAKQCCFISINHVSRNANRVAHNLAQLSKNFQDLRVWME
ncbi:Slit-like protein 2 protein [Bienertia sinuspersici]